MGEKIVVGPITKGLQTNVLPFNVDNDSFPVLYNAQSWRGRIRRKRGNKTLGRLTRYFDSNDSQFNPGTTSLSLDGSGNGNLLTGFTSSGIESTAQIVPTSVSITGTLDTYTDPSGDGTLSPSGSINYATGAITIAAEASNSITALFNYYPNLAVLGINEFNPTTSQFQGNILFDDTYSYNLASTSPFTIHSVSFYFNPATSGSYTQKTNWTPINWNGQNYQQYWGINYAGALWVTNGVTVPFTTTNIGMQFKTITAVTNVSGSSATLTIASHGLVIGDWLFLNELKTVTGMNFQTCYVSAVPTASTVTVIFPNSSSIAGTTTGLTGVAQYLTSNADSTLDCLRYYTGSPVSSASPPVFSTSGGWVNYCPPISLSSYSIADLTSAQYYLVGAKLIFPYKDRLLFLGPVVQTSTGSPIYLDESIVFTQNGTPYYTASFDYSGTVNPTAADLVTSSFTPYVVPSNQTAIPSCMFSDVAGYGGWITAGFDQPIITVSSNDDVLIIGFEQNIQSRLYYTSNDLLPFAFYVITSEYGAEASFSAINFDQGVLSVGTQGLIVTNQTTAQRVDVQIPDQIFQFKRTGNGIQRVTAQRDYINEWVYFSFVSNQSAGTYPDQTLLYNYRNNTWGLYKENFTSYGTFRAQSGQTWDQLTDFTWDEWSDPWDSGEETLLAPEVIGGNAQGYIQQRAEDTGEDVSGYFSAFSSNTVTATNHGLQNGDYIIISGALGALGSSVNGNVYSIRYVDEDSFELNPPVDDATYLGNGEFTRMYVPFIQTKQFPVAWGIDRQTRLGPQMYLFTTTDSGEITLNIYLSQDSANPYTKISILPSLSENNALVYSNILSTSSNANNLQTMIDENAPRTWHRVNNSLIGDTVQIGITLSDTQMRHKDGDGNIDQAFEEIELHSFVLDVNPSRLLA